MFTCDFFTVHRLEPHALAAALATVLNVPVESVDVADKYDDVRDDRDWDAPVLCDYHVLPDGDLAVVLDVSVQGSVASDLTEQTLCDRLAAASGTTVVYPAEWFPPSAYWAATPEGLVTRCRVDASDDEEPSYVVDAVEQPVPHLLKARVEPLPEGRRERRNAAQGLAGTTPARLLGLYHCPLDGDGTAAASLEAVEIVPGDADTDADSVVFTSWTDWTLRVGPGTWPKVPYWCHPPARWQYRDLLPSIGSQAEPGACLAVEELTDEVGEAHGAVLRFARGSLAITVGEAVTVSWTEDSQAVGGGGGQHRVP
ncbi:hypothetical protein [Streptomyces sp. XD-27]|uniref:hypothetical protein n=1 Tax=Streptomyces sp. XD-27 TaxID=3062779 RepID=UPI0026F42BAF|nr:hypothetical protein [Streptomyces sp. XD-27]WKX72335.1 hypothetical protein Q3Y56_22700 [Streptomyces sp. XD-27]